MKIVETQPVVRRQSPQGGATVTLPARPEAIAFAPQETALIVVDMQNAYASQGGYLDLAGFDVSTTAPVIANIKRAITAARAAGIKVIFSRTAGTISTSKPAVKAHLTGTSPTR